MLVAQAWWDAAYNATTAQRQSPARLGLGQGAPGVRCAVGITGMQERSDSAGRAAAMLSSTTTMEVGIDIGALRAEPPGLLRRPGHVLCRQLEGRRPRLPADLHRPLRRCSSPSLTSSWCSTGGGNNPSSISLPRIISRISSAVMSPRSRSAFGSATASFMALIRGCRKLTQSRAQSAPHSATHCPQSENRRTGLNNLLDLGLAVEIRHGSRCFGYARSAIPFGTQSGSSYFKGYSRNNVGQRCIA